MDWTKQSWFFFWTGSLIKYSIPRCILIILHWLFSPFPFLPRSSCIRFHGFLSMPCVLKGAADSSDRTRWAINITTRKKNRSYKGTFLSPAAENQVLQLVVVGKKMWRTEVLDNLCSPSSTLYSDAPYVVLCLAILSTLLDSWIQS